MKVLILNGPNLNMLGKREKVFYGEQSFDAFLPELKEQFPDIELTYKQSNVEGELINWLQRVDGNYDAVVINPGGYAHTSVALADALKIVVAPVIEVHISNIFAREPFRHGSLTGAQCQGCVTGFGLKGYALAIESIRR
ncbi:MAG: type II 3-dehydroquinate dehydratase [Bacteroidales bacterium]|nr:type II 3-dehydroquinate dehydratase [Bacteroidales bacterium]